MTDQPSPDSESGAPRRHELKTIPPFFQDILEGRKTFELRKNDRGFRVGDVLWLREWRNGPGFSGRSIDRRVVYLIGDDELLPPEVTGLGEDHVILGLAAMPYRSAPPIGDRSHFQESSRV